MKKLLVISIIVFGFDALPAHAGWLEDVQKNPVFQNLLNRAVDLPPALKLCEDAKFASANKEKCAATKAADVASRVPSEMRSLMLSEKASSALRILCSSNPAQFNVNYLCLELQKADKAFKASGLNDPGQPQVGDPNFRY